MRIGSTARIAAAGLLLAAMTVSSSASAPWTRTSTPIAAGLLGLANSFRMARLPDPTPSGSTEGVALG
jgi:hypothetical protein